MPVYTSEYNAFSDKMSTPISLYDILSINDYVAGIRKNA
jgi:hypothetical protein